MSPTSPGRPTSELPLRLALAALVVGCLALFGVTLIGGILIGRATVSTGSSPVATPTAQPTLKPAPTPPPNYCSLPGGGYYRCSVPTLPQDCMSSLPDDFPVYAGAELLSPAHQRSGVWQTDASPQSVVAFFADDQGKQRKYAFRQIGPSPDMSGATLPTVTLTFSARSIGRYYRTSCSGMVHIASDPVGNGTYFDATLDEQ